MMRGYRHSVDDHDQAVDEEEVRRIIHQDVGLDFLPISADDHRVRALLSR